MFGDLVSDLSQLLCDVSDRELIPLCNDNELIDDFVYCMEEDYDYYTERNKSIVNADDFSFEQPYFYIDNNNVAHSCWGLDYEDYENIAFYMLSSNECFNIPEVIDFFEEHNLPYKKHNLFLVEFTDTHEIGIVDKWDIESVNHNSRKWSCGNILKIIREATEEDLVKYGYNQ